ncbi:hypothetical protein ACFLX5_03915 [Chloroflexota bacterium]
MGRKAMRIRINTIELVGTDRVVYLEPGLNIIAGPISSGKTTLLRLCRALLGSPIEGFPREVRSHVTALSGSLTIGDCEYSLSRPFTGTPTAKVDIASDREANRLPVLQKDPSSDKTYGAWLLEKLGLPRLEVPQAPTKPESARTPVSINDYLLYCMLTQEDIDTSVFGHSDPYKNSKRKYVFEILYGIYNLEIAQLQDEYREIQFRLRRVAADKEAVDRLLGGTPLENRVELERELAAAMEQCKDLEQGAISLASPPTMTSITRMLQDKVRRIDNDIHDISHMIEQTSSTIKQLRTLMAQLETQSERLTRSIVARRYLLDFEFVVCPRCGSDIGIDRDSTEVCRLCLQSPKAGLTRADLINEQDAVGGQILETRDLIQMHEQKLANLQRQIDKLSEERDRLAHDLNVQTQSYISDSADKITMVAQRRAETGSRIAQLTDYLNLIRKLDSMVVDIARLSERKDELEAKLDYATARVSDQESRIRYLDDEFRAILKEICLPGFVDPSKGVIDRETYLPILDGRRFSELSSLGLKVLVNVAHALAHQRTGIALDLALPNILFIDGLTANVGQEGLDMERIIAVYRILSEISEKLGDRLQIIAADSHIPREAEQYVRIRMSEDDRLIRILG